MMLDRDPDDDRDDDDGDDTKMIYEACLPIGILSESEGLGGFL